MHGTALNIPPPALECTRYEVNGQRLDLNGPANHWTRGDLPNTIGLAADLLASDILAGCSGIESDFAKPSTGLKMTFVVHPMTTMPPWKLALMWGSEDSNGLWFELKKPTLRSGPRSRLEACLCHAMTCARQDPDQPAHAINKEIEYAVTWNNLSNHRKLELEARSRTPIAELIPQPR